MAIYSVGENVYILTLFREYGSHRSKTLSIFSLQNDEDEGLLQHCYTHAVPSTSNHIYQGIYYGLNYVVITRERGFELGILLNDNMISVTIPNSSLLSACLIRNDWILLALDSGGLVLYTKNTLRPVVLSDELQTSVFSHIVDLGDLILLIAEGGNSFLVKARDLYQIELTSIRSNQITQSMAPCSEMCISYDDGYPVLSFISGRGVASRMIEGRYGMVLSLDKRLSEGTTHHIYVIRWKNESFLCISNQTQTNVFRMINDSLLPFSLTELSQQPSLVIGTIGNTLIQVVCDSIRWIVGESIHSHSISMITKAFLFDSELFVIVNSTEIWRWSNSSLYQCECVMKCDSPILQIDYLEDNRWTVATSNSVRLIQSGTEVFSISLPYPPQSITHLSTFHSILLLIQLPSTVQYYQVMSESLILLQTITIQSNASLSRLAISGIEIVTLSPYIILPSSPFQLLPVTILSNSHSISSSFSIIEVPSVLSTPSVLLVYDSQSIYLSHCSLKGCQLDLQYESIVTSVQHIFQMNSDQLILTKHSLPSLILYRLQNHNWTSQELSLSPITALITLDTRVIAVVESNPYELICFSSFPDITSSITFSLPAAVSLLQPLPQSHCVLVCGDSLCVYHIAHTIELITSLTVCLILLSHIKLPNTHLTALLTYQNTIITTSADGVISFFRFIESNSLIRILTFPSLYHIISACLLDPRSIAVGTYEGILCIFRCVRSVGMNHVINI